MGVRGFRFDAAKHIPPDYVKQLSSMSCNASLPAGEKMINYVEVMDGDVNICNEYILDNGKILRAADFPLTFSLNSLFSHGENLRELSNVRHLDASTAVIFANCHDSILGDAYKFDSIDAQLAAAYILATSINGAIPLIYYTELESPFITAGIQFYHTMKEQQLYSINEESDDNLLIISRGDSGLVFINKSGDYKKSSSLKLPYMKVGIYHELVYNFDISIDYHNSTPNITSWGAPHKEGYDIGPRCALFLLWRSNH